MNEERRRILEMLAKGTITPEQANELLDVLDEEVAASAAARPNPARTFTRASRRERRSNGSGMSPALQKLTEARMMGVTTEYIREMSELGFAGSALEELVQMRVHGITPDFVREVRDLGLDLDTGDLIKLRIGGVDARFILQMQEMGLLDMDEKAIDTMGATDAAAAFDRAAAREEPEPEEER